MRSPFEVLYKAFTKRDPQEGTTLTHVEDALVEEVANLIHRETSAGPGDCTRAARRCVALFRDRESVALKLFSAHHEVEFSDQGWNLQHPLSCRPNLMDCSINRAMNNLTKRPVPENGTYIVDYAEGRLTFEPKGESTNGSDA